MVALSKARRVGFLCGLALVHVCVFDGAVALESTLPDNQEAPKLGTEQPEGASESATESLGEYASDGKLEEGTSTVGDASNWKVEEGTSTVGRHDAQRSRSLSPVRRLLAELGSFALGRRLSSSEVADVDELQEELEEIEQLEAEIREGQAHQSVDEVDQGEDSSGTGEEGVTSRRLAVNGDVDNLSRLIELASRNLEEKINDSAPAETRTPQEGGGEDGVKAALERTRTAAKDLVEAASLFFESLGELISKSAEKPLADAAGVSEVVKSKISEGSAKLGQVTDEVSDRVTGAVSQALSSLLLQVAKTNPSLFAEATQQAIQLQKKLAELQEVVAGYGGRARSAAELAAEKAKGAAEIAADYAIDAAATGADAISRGAAHAHTQLRRTSSRN